MITCPFRCVCVCVGARAGAGHGWASVWGDLRVGEWHGGVAVWFCVCRSDTLVASGVGRCGVLSVPVLERGRVCDVLFRCRRFPGDFVWGVRGLSVLWFGHGHVVPGRERARWRSVLRIAERPTGERCGFGFRRACGCACRPRPPRYVLCLQVCAERCWAIVVQAPHVRRTSWWRVLPFEEHG